MNRTRIGLFTIWTIVWKTGLFLILWGTLLAPFIIPFSDKLKQAQQSSPLQIQLMIEFSSALTILAAAWIMAAFVDRRSFVTLGFSPAHVIHDFLLGLSLGAGWLALSVLILWLAGWLHVRPTGVVTPSTLAWMAAALFFNTVAQEVLARSYVFQTIQSQANAAVAVVVSAILFMAYHAGAYRSSLLPPFNVFAAGILFGLSFYLTRNLWLPIGIHFMWNFLVGPLLGLTISGNNQVVGAWQILTLQGPVLFTGGSFGLEGGLVVTSTTLVGVAAMIYSCRRQKKTGLTQHPAAIAARNP